MQVDNLLLKALQVFLQYGYKKTSLDDVAKKVGVSRQTLYQKYKNKETLFKSAIQHSLEFSIYNTKIVHNDESLDLNQKLFKAFDIWCGQYVEILKHSEYAAEIMDATSYLSEGLIEEKQVEFMAIIINLFATANFKKPTEQAETFYFTAKGITHYCKDYNDFKEKLTTAIDLICKK